MSYGNGTTQTWTFDNRKRISHLKVEGPNATVLEDLAYTLSPSGNILSINDTRYDYDGFNRIVEARTAYPEAVDYAKLVRQHFGSYRDSEDPEGLPYNPEADLNRDGRVNGVDHILASYLLETEAYDLEGFAYDKAGNRTKLTQNGDEYAYEYGVRNQLSRVYLKKAGQGSRALFAEYSYDANGNTVRRVLYPGGIAKETNFEYDTLNRLVRSTEAGVSRSYRYDNAGNRLIKEGPEGLTVYLRQGQIAVAMDLEVYAPSSPEAASKKGRINRYVLSGDLLAGRISQVVKLDGTKEAAKSYYHLDHLNSTKSLSDGEGKLEVSYVYRAFGEQLRKLGQGEAKYSYGGKELDSATNLYYFNARFYDATTGRFVNVDPIQDGTNWYSYCSNNPLGMVDLTGLFTIYALGFDKSDKKLTSATFDSKTLAIKVKQYDADNHVRTNQNGERLSPDIKTMPKDGGQSKNYYTAPFPNGLWDIKDVSHQNNNTYGTSKISTNAEQTVNVYKIDGSGGYTPDGTQIDTGYAIHGGGFTGNPLGDNNISDNTLGCIRVKNSTADSIASDITAARADKSGSIIKLKVQD